MTDKGKPPANLKFFVYAPPLKGTRPSKRKPPKPPYKGAPTWQTSVYYYWWEYLRRHEGYARTCQNGGKGRYAKLYEDFGNVHSGTFWDWWTKHAHLFSEPPPPYARIVALSDVQKQPPNTVLLQVSLEQRLALTIKQIKAIMGDMVMVDKRRKTPSRALYPVYTKPVLSTLHRCLQVWDVKKAHPDWANFLIKDYVDGKLTETDIELFLSTDDTVLKMKIAGNGKDRVEKTHAVSRDYRAAEEYIENVVLGEFPKRNDNREEPLNRTV